MVKKYKEPMLLGVGLLYVWVLGGVVSRELLSECDFAIVVQSVGD